MTLSSLKSRVRAASGPDRELFHDVMVAVGVTEGGSEFEKRIWCLIDAEAWEQAATELVEHVKPGWGWAVGRPLGGVGFWADLFNEAGDAFNQQRQWRDKGVMGSASSVWYAPTPTLALLLALMEAMETHECR